jgi:hypothetical protein
MALDVIKKHSTGDLLEGQILFSCSTDATAPTGFDYHISTLKTASGIIALVFDTRLASNPNKEFRAMDTPYMANFAFPTEFLSKVVSASGVYGSAGSGQVTIPSASMAGIGSSAVTSDVSIASVVGTSGTTVPTVTPKAPTATPAPTAAPTVTPAPTATPSPSTTPSPSDTPAAPKALGAFAEMSTGVKVLIVAIIVGVAGYFGNKFYKNRKKGKK